MNTRVGKKYLLIPFIYIVLIALFLYLHFGAADTFKTSLDGLKITGKGKSSLHAASSGLQEIEVSFLSLTTRIDRNSSISLITPAGEEQKVNLIGVELDGETFRILFEKNLALNFQVSKQDEALSIRPEFTGTTPDFKEIIIPYIIPGRYTFSQPKGLNLLSIGDDTERYYLSLSEGGSFYPEEQRVRIPRKGEVRFQQSAISDPYVFFFGSSLQKTGVEEYKNLLQDYFDAAYLGWKSRRYNTTLAVWSIPGSRGHFLEKTAVAYLSEALLRNEYGIAIERMNQGAELHPDSITILSSPFLGNTVNVGNDWFTNLEENHHQQLQMLSDKGDIFAPGSSYFKQILAIDNGIIREKCIDHYSEHPPIDPKEMILLLEALEIPEFDGMTGVHDLLASTAFNLFPFIRKTDKGVFIELSTGFLSTEYSVRGGLALTTAAATLTDDLLNLLGRTLVVSSLKLKDDTAILPAYVHLDENSPPEMAGELTPEELYPYLSSNPYYPHITNLGEGMFLWSALREISYTATEDKQNLTFSFPAGFSHHFVLHGVSDFSRLSLFGINWNSDTRFQHYSSGWLKQGDNLFLKIRHRKQEEQLELILESPTELSSPETGE
ncbi:MAG: hypothetical protein KAU17_11785 [Spirochaetales bacterium]|nr:hypothetical protein [Spirochaetales bacterium]